MNIGAPDLGMLRNALQGRTASTYWAMGAVKYAPGNYLASMIYKGALPDHSKSAQVQCLCSSTDSWVDSNGENFGQKAGGFDQVDMYIAGFVRYTADADTGWIQLAELQRGPHLTFVGHVPPQAVYFSWALPNTQQPVVTMALEIANQALW